jgi:TrmH family RNA methyltransferase
MSQTITSTNNDLIKLVLSLQHKKFRKLENLALIEGSKIINEAINSGQNIVNLFIADDKLEKYKELVNKVDVEVIISSTKILKLISPTKTPQGIVAIIEAKYLSPMVIADDFLVLDHIQDPGNLGAIIRSAVASGFKNVFMINCVDMYNDKVLRASMGNIFKSNNFSVNFEKLSELLKVKEDYELLLADLSGDNIFEIDLPKNKTIGIIIGNEGSGVSDEVRGLSTKTVNIPMQNDVESLNAAVSASIIMYNIKN